MIVDAVGIVEQEKVDTQTLERKRGKTFRASCSKPWPLGVSDDDTLVLSGRSAGQAGQQAERRRPERIRAAGDSRSGLEHIAAGDPGRHRPDSILAAAAGPCAIPNGGRRSSRRAASWWSGADARWQPTPTCAACWLKSSERSEQMLDTISVDTVLEAGFAAEDTEKARLTVESFRAVHRGATKTKSPPCRSSSTSLTPGPSPGGEADGRAA